MKSGCYTALATPFEGDGVDYQGLEQLVDFQISNGITGILAVGTTGESPTLSWEEHNRVVETVVGKCKGKCISIAGAGSNNTREALAAAEHASQAGAAVAGEKGSEDRLVLEYFKGEWTKSGVRLAWTTTQEVDQIGTKRPVDTLGDIGAIEMP